MTGKSRLYSGAASALAIAIALGAASAASAPVSLKTRTKCSAVFAPHVESSGILWTARAAVSCFKS